MTRGWQGRRQGEMIVPVRQLPVLAALIALAAPAAEAGAATARSALPSFDSCRDLVGHARAAVARTGGATGVPTRAFPATAAALPSPWPRGGAMEGDALAAPMPVAAAPAAGKAEGAPEVSGTNNQEAGVDEADVVKTDGRRVFVVQGGKLRVLDLTTNEPTELGGLQLPGFGHQLLLRGDRLLVSAETSGPVGVARAATSPAPSFRATTVLTEVDVSDPRKPTVARTMELKGRLVAGRLTGGTARVVVASPPEDVDVPQAATTRDFVPRTILRSRRTNRTFRRLVVPCDDVRRPRRFSGLDLVTVLTVDLDKGLFNVDRDAVLAGAETVYASPTSLYVASRRWSPALDEAGHAVPQGMRTEVHRFDTSEPDQTTYAASGSVPGFVLNQFSLGEHEGRLRVATTEEPQWFGDAPARASESGISVLEQRGGKLVQVGRVGGLGKTERIYSVRFVGDVGYVVTFRQVDPLYTVDLQDPTRPAVRGELKVLGYSSYLHPVRDGLLLGIGQDATPEGRRAGTQVSLFDVSDLSKPMKLSGVTLGQGTSSSAEHDHHAFLYWERAKLAVVPLEQYGSEPFAGGIGFRVDDKAGVAELARITHPSEQSYVPIGRSVVLGDRLLTVSALGVGVNRLGDLAPLSFTPFA